jgi:hypothetical protein
MISARKIMQVSLVAATCAVFGIASALAQAPTPADVKAAQTLYQQKQYAAAADAFEKIIAHQSTASNCYYAALSNRAARRETRARQLFEYVAKNFPTSVEASYCKQVIGTSGTASSSNGVATTVSESSGEDELPESVKALIPPSMQGMMKTPEGRRAIADAMRQNSNQLSTIRQAEKQGTISPTKVAGASLGIGLEKPMPQKGTGDKLHPFTAEDIARSGAAAIDQVLYPNCWFECSMAALAELPRGQRLIASMITSRGKDTYVVRFPGDGNEYVITMDDLNKAKIKDSALWASLIECAQTRKFPNNRGAEGASGEMSRLEVGLGCMTGCKADVLEDLREMSDGQLSSFIGSAIKSQNPVVAGTWHVFSGPYIVVPRHAYTITGFDPSKNMITIRNPWGKGSHLFGVDDADKNDFEELDNGVFKMSIKYFKHYYNSVARSFI